MTKSKGLTFIQVMWFILMVAIIAIAGALIISAPAHAGDWNTSTSTSDSLSVSDSKSLAVQGNGNAQNITINSAAADRVTVRTTPQVYAPSMNATAPCRISVSAGISVIGWGASAGGSVEDVLCSIRENSRFLDALGEREAAVRLFCFDKRAAQVMGSERCKGIDPIGDK